jgi:methionine-gamma-lyase
LSEGAVKPPVFLTSTFAFKTAEEGAEFFDVTSGRKPMPEGYSGGLIYSRFNHPNLEIIEGKKWFTRSNFRPGFFVFSAPIVATIREY